MNVIVTLKNGSKEIFSDYTDYTVKDGLFIVINEGDWVGIFPIDNIMKVVVK